MLRIYVNFLRFCFGIRCNPFVDLLYCVRKVFLNHLSDEGVLK